MSTLTTKAGDTFSRSMTWSVDDVAVDLTGYTITSKLRLPGDTSDDAALATLTATADADQVTNVGVFVLSSDDTADWPIKTLVCDVRFTSSGGQVSTTETFEIAVRRAVSR